jgi:hypothetical protein
VPKGFYGIVLPPELPLQDSVDDAKAMACERVAERREAARRESLIPLAMREKVQSLVEERNELDRELKSVCAELLEAVHSSHTEKAAKSVMLGQKIVEMGGRLQVVTELLDAIVKEMDAIRQSG